MGALTARPERGVDASGKGPADRHDGPRCEQLSVRGRGSGVAEAVGKRGVVLGDDERHTERRREADRGSTVRQAVMRVDDIESASR